MLKVRAYVIYDIHTKSYEHFDKECLATESEISLKGTNNSIMVIKPEDFNERTCKLIKDVKAKTNITVEVVPVPIRTRLDKIK